MDSDKMRILLIEDEGIIALAMKIKLESMGFQVIGMAGNGQAAMEKAKELAPDVLLMDIKLRGGMDGIETVKAIHKFRFIPVIYTSAYDDFGIFTNAEKTRHEGIISKPIDFDDLVRRLETIARQYKTGGDEGVS